MTSRSRAAIRRMPAAAERERMRPRFTATYCASYSRWGVEKAMKWNKRPLACGLLESTAMGWFCRWIVALVMGIALIGLTTRASAESFAPADMDVSALVTLGGSHSSAWNGSNFVDLGIDGVLRWQFLAAGIGGEWKTVLFANAEDVHGSFGLSIPVSDFRFDALGCYGLRYYGDWGKSLLGGDPGASAQLPFAGIRLRATYDLRPSKRFTVRLGFVFGYDNDLARRHVDYAYTEQDWLFDDNRYLTTGHQDIGASYWTSGFTVGTAFGLL